MSCTCGDLVVLCPMHAAAQEMLYHTRVNAALPCPGRTECGVLAPCNGCRARALLATIEEDKP